MQKCEALFLPLGLNEALVKRLDPFMPLCFDFLVRLLSYHYSCQLSVVSCHCDMKLPQFCSAPEAPRFHFLCSDRNEKKKNEKKSS